MDDFLKIFIWIVGGIIYLLYKKNKVILKEGQVPKQEEIPRPKTRLEQIFEEIEQNNSNEDEFFQEEINEPENIENKYKTTVEPDLTSNKTNQEKESVKFFFDEEEEQYSDDEKNSLNLTDFDITKAVIYNEILNPKFKEM